MTMLDQDQGRAIAARIAPDPAGTVALEQARTLAACVQHISELELLLRDVLAENWTFLPSALARRIQIALRELPADDVPQPTKEAANG